MTLPKKMGINLANLQHHILLKRNHLQQIRQSQMTYYAYFELKNSSKPSHYSKG